MVYYGVIVYATFDKALLFIINHDITNPRKEVMFSIHNHLGENNEKNQAWYINYMKVHSSLLLDFEFVLDFLPFCVLA